ncbi:hypothetical protein [Halarsenatibacter silvermanii]|uniref:Uncharacterized protein n=1 Tax=Halarsenatibacter silvermanii TaxID=321763 RepID=A0A1G9M1V1_9FIRM|nr:hypothetical protein [Halarsenatibacter silvermanii]SDL68239.1 hypothetical protein SAMN04488692_10781 [Halarsenatibacter silvermanii]
MEVPGAESAGNSVQQAMSTAVTRQAMNQDAGTIDALMESVEEIQEAAQQTDRASMQGMGENVDFLA